MKPPRPIQAETRIKVKPVRPVDPGRTGALAGKRVPTSTTKVDLERAIEKARELGANRRSG